MINYTNPDTEGQIIEKGQIFVRKFLGSQGYKIIAIREDNELARTEYDIVAPESELLALNKSRGYIGTARYEISEDLWYFYADNGVTYKVFEPDDGIDTILELCYKRIQVPAD